MYAFKVFHMAAVQTPNDGVLANCIQVDEAVEEQGDGEMQYQRLFRMQYDNEVGMERQNEH